MFIRDRAAYDLNLAGAYGPLKDETAKLSESGVTVLSDMRVKGIA